MKTIKILLASITLMFGVTPLLQATVLLYDNFDSGTVGNPVPVPPWSPYPAAEGTATYSSNAITGNSMQVVNTRTDASVDNYSLFRPFSENFIYSSGDTLTFSASVMIESTTEIWQTTFQLRGATNAVLPIIGINFNSQAGDRRVMVNTGEGAVNLLKSDGSGNLIYNLDTWYDFTLTLHSSTGTFDVDFSGAQSQYGLSVVNAIDIGYFMGFIGSRNENNSSFYMDNLSVTAIPEPRSLSLLVFLGCFALLGLYRKRK